MTENEQTSDPEDGPGVLLPSYRWELRQYASETLLIIARVLLNTIAMSSVISAWYLLELLLDATGASADQTIRLLISLGSYAFIVISVIIIVYDVITVFLRRWRMVRRKTR